METATIVATRAPPFFPATAAGSCLTRKERIETNNPRNPIATDAAKASNPGLGWRRPPTPIFVASQHTYTERATKKRPAYRSLFGKVRPFQDDPFTLCLGDSLDAVGRTNLRHKGDNFPPVFFRRVKQPPVGSVSRCRPAGTQQHPPCGAKTEARAACSPSGSLPRGQRLSCGRFHILYSDLKLPSLAISAKMPHW